MPSKKKSTKPAPGRAAKDTARTVKRVGSSLRKPSQGQREASKAIKATGKQIKAANKQIANDTRNAKKAAQQTKKQAQQIKKTTKAASKLVKAIKKIVIPPKKQTPKKTQPKKKTLTLADYGRLLGEDFESLAQAKRAYSRETKKTKGGKRRTPEQPKRAQGNAPVKVLPDVNPRKRIYVVRDLPEAQQNSVLNGTLEDLREAAPMYDDLLKPGEIWGFRFGTNARGGYSYATFDNFHALIDRLSEYKTVEDYGDDPSAYDDLTGLIKVIRYKAKGSTNKEDAKQAWQQRKRAEINKRQEKAAMYEERRKERARKKRQLQQELKRERKESRAAKDAAEKAHNAALAANQKLMWERAQRKSLERKLERLQNREVERIHKELNPRKGKKK